MALAWHATGPTLIQLKAAAADASWVNFCRTDNEDLVGFEIVDHQREFTRNDLGDMVAEVITTGSTCRIEITSTYWDEPVLENAVAQMRLGTQTSAAANEGRHAEVGKLMFTDNRLQGMKIVTTRAGEKSYEFRYVRLVGHRVRDMGNTQKKLIMVWESMPDPSTGRFYTATVNT